MRRFDAVVCDLDGTLVDTADDLTAALDAVLVAHGRRALGPAGRALIGEGAHRLVEKGFLATGGAAPDFAAAMDDFFRRYEARIAACSRAYPGVRATLEGLAASGIALGVCTNKALRSTRALLRALDLDGFFAYVHDIDSGPKKPDPAPLRATLAALNSAPGRALMVGDSAIDVATARALGVKVAVVSFGYSTVPPRELGGDWLIDRFDQVLALVTDG